MVAKKGEKYMCEECGAEVRIEKDCNCKSCGISCCDKPMKKV